MNEPKFTPGPWYRCGARVGFGIAQEGTGKPVATTVGIADSCLITAAPDLYAAMEELVTKLVIDDEEGLIEYAEPIIKARAALAKARGEEAPHA